MDSLVFLDVETTGLDGQRERIIEIYMLKVYSNGEYEQFETLLNPSRSIPKKITEITGITDQHVVNAPTEKEMADEIRSFISEGVVIAHNLSFDLKFLQAMFRRQRIAPISRDGIDTLKWSRRLFPKLAVFPKSRGSHTLENLMYQFGLDGDFKNSHRAKDDVLLLVQVYRMLDAFGSGQLGLSFPTLITEGCPQCRKALHIVKYDQAGARLHCAPPKGCGFGTEVSLVGQN